LNLIWVTNSMAWVTSLALSLGATSLLGLHLTGQWNTLPYACILTRVLEYANFSNMFVLFIHCAFLLERCHERVFSRGYVCRKARALFRDIVSSGATSLFLQLGLHLLGKWNTMPYAFIHTRVLEYATFPNMYVIFIHGAFITWAMLTCFLTKLCLLSEGSCPSSGFCIFWGYGLHTGYGLRTGYSKE
jgi:hypothetical protein